MDYLKMLKETYEALAFELREKYLNTGDREALIKARTFEEAIKIIEDIK